MKLIATIIGLMLIPYTSMAIDSSGNYAVWGIGSKSCYAFNMETVNYLNPDNTSEKEEQSLISKLKFWEHKEKNQKKTEHFDLYKNYIKGFITAYNIFTDNTYSITGIMKEREVIEWLNNYCKENPMSSLENSLTNFTFEHYEGRMKTNMRRGR